DEVFVRQPDQAQSWLAQGSLSVDADPQLWMRRDILNIDHARIAHVSVQRDGTTLAFDAKDGKLTMVAPNAHAPLDDDKLDDLARGLEQLNCEDVVPGAAPTTGGIGQTVFTTTNGLGVTVRLYQNGKTMLARFDVTGDGAAKAEASALEKRVGPWTYQLATWKETALVPRLTDLEKKPDDKAAPGNVSQ
ncbi:MAG TPA: DUF4340 domain-containing protein, partial [Acetobacteraceae bacterium]